MTTASNINTGSTGDGSIGISEADGVSYSNGGLTILGTDGDDVISGGPGDHTILSLSGDDTILDEEGYNHVMGGHGNDSIMAHGVIDGGPGDDDIVAVGNASENIYKFGLGDGRDKISAIGDQPGTTAQGTLEFGQGIRPDSVYMVRHGNHLSFHIGHIGRTDQVTILDWFKSPAHQVANITFADGTIWWATGMASMDISILGTAGNDILHGDAGNNLINAGPGNDRIVDSEGDNILYGGQGNDIVTGRGALDGGLGNDTLRAAGDAQYNYYFYGLGDGSDVLHAKGDSNPGRPEGNVAFSEELDASRLWFRQVGADLAINVVGSQEGMTIKDWYRDNSNQVKRFIDGRDRVMSNDKVDALVQAMAGFDAPLSGNSRLSDAVSAALAPVMAASWT